MQAFSWELAESLATAHMRALGFLDARTTAAGADKGIDVISTGAAAQVKALKSPVGAPDVQKLKGSAHLIENQLFYSLSGYTDQAVKFADSASVALFKFDILNNVEPVNSVAVALESSSEAKTGYADTKGMIEQAQAQNDALLEFLMYLTDWVCETPWGLNYRGNALSSCFAFLSISRESMPSAADIVEQREWAENVLASHVNSISQLGTVLGIDLSGLDLEQARESLERVRQGDLSNFKVPEHLIPLFSKRLGEKEGWLYLAEVNTLVNDLQKFLKMLNQVLNDAESTDKRFAESPDAREHWEAVMKLAGEFQEWANTAYSGELAEVDEGRMILEKLRVTAGQVCSIYGFDVETIYSRSSLMPISWLNEVVEEEE
jgi:hypothetical protein